MSESKVKTPDQLLAMYPYMFVPGQLGYDIAAGWLADFVKLCGDIDVLLGEDKRGFHWRQLKEKMGGARYYFELRGRRSTQKELAAAIAKLVLAAEAKSDETCIFCGKPANINNVGGYLLSECSEHFIRRQKGGVESPWLDTNGLEASLGS